MDNPLLTMLGRRGRGAVVAALLGHPGQDWNAAALAEAARVHPVVAGRAVKELAALGAIETARPGRDLVIRWRTETPAARFLAGLIVPDLRDATRRAFAHGYAGPGAVLRWTLSEEALMDPLTPTHLAIRTDDEEAAWEAVGAALDAVREAGLPPPDVSVHQSPVAPPSQTNPK